MGSLFIVNFNGADGATTWTEEVENLTPDASSNFVLDTDYQKFGTASLFGNQSLTSNLKYILGASIDGNFTVHGFVRFSDITFSTGDRSYLTRVNSEIATLAYALIQLTDVGGTTKVTYQVTDKNGSNIGTDEIVNPFSDVTWHHVAFIVNNRDIKFTVDGVVKISLTASVDNPLAGTDSVRWYSINSFGRKVWYDAWEIVDEAKWTSFPFSPPEAPPALPPEFFGGTISDGMGLSDTVDSLMTEASEGMGMSDTSEEHNLQAFSDTMGMSDSYDFVFFQYVHRLTGGVIFPVMKVEGQTGNNARGEVVFPVMSVEMDVGKAIEIIAPVMTVDGTAIVSPADIYGDVIFPVMEVEATGLTGILATGDVIFPRKFLDVEGTTIFDPVNCTGAVTFPSLSVNAIATKSSLATGYCLNTSNFALVQYSNFEFITACEFNGKVICGGTAGIFEHVGDLDVSAEIDAYFDLPSNDYGTHNQKSFRKVFVEGESVGNLTVTTLIDNAVGDSYTIDSLGVVGDNQYVFPLNHEDRGSNVGIRISNKHGADFAINAVYGTLVLGRTLPKGYSILARGKVVFPTTGISANAS